MGGVVPVVNVPGITAGQLKLTGTLLADIYLGKVSKWNDPAITALNPGVNLPDSAITVVRRSDGSGTTFIFTNYLSRVSEEWKTKVGENSAVNWPAGVGGKGNEGVANYVTRIKGCDWLCGIRLRQAKTKLPTPRLKMQPVALFSLAMTALKRPPTPTGKPPMASTKS